MTTRDESFSNMQDSLENDPISHPIGYYMHEIRPGGGGAGGFHWHKNVKSLLNEIERDLYTWITEDDEYGDEVKNGISDILKLAVANDADVSLDELLDALNGYLINWDTYIDWAGEFHSLCVADDDWANRIREDFHDEITPVGDEEIDNFIEFISAYGQS